MATVNMENNRVRHDKNKARLTGRHDGLFFLEGQARGGGNHVETVTYTLYEARYAGPDEVCDVLGVGENGNRTPYEELHAQVKPVPMTKRTTFDVKGTPIKVEIQPEG